ncbi:DUF4279 domain-containing protein [Actinopolymorpha sp. B17G11]|uniref:DUF4279 domain-containing protein n=1 Tax=Actinopolymorpha sp. B17G11 TaxID=3160861 RepID=UPI0032E422CC
MAELARALAALRIAGEALVPTAITTALGCEPSRSWAKGDAWISHGVTRTRRFGLWSLDAEETILGRLTSDEAVWRDLGARYTVDLFCGWFMERGNEGVTLGPETMLALGRRGIPLDVDLYGGDESADG